jgi:myosin heavy subunit
MAKYIYSKLFDTIVHYVNTSLFKGKAGQSIGVLDIFGFEGKQDLSLHLFRRPLSTVIVDEM